MLKPVNAPFDVIRTRRTLFEALLDACERYGKKKPILEDADRQPLTYGRLVLGALVLGDKLARVTEPGETVGVLLPNVTGLPVTLFGLSAYGRVPAMLNFTAGPRNIAAALKIGRIGSVVTSRRFVEQGRLEDVIAALETAKVHYLEDVRRTIKTKDKLWGLVRAALARSFYRRHASDPDSPGVVLFTSGSEGAPKGVVLSHANLIANALQIAAHDGGGVLDPSDIVMNPLPMFHSYGLTAGTLLGLFTGMKVVLYPSPLHFKQVTKLIGETKASVLFGTDTFMRHWARAADAGDLASVRLVIAGAERVKDETRRMWERFGTVILEGYGATECSPVIACNSPRHNRPGTVGPFLPGIEWRLEPVEGIADAGRLHVRGPNVMKGYLLAARPGELVPPPGGWHDTGDIVTVENDGSVVIRGRAKRFAKIGGEMVSLAAVEAMVAGLWPEANHVVVALPDAAKGEQLVLVTDKADADRDALRGRAKAEGYPELWVPRALMVVASIPVLGSGKVDFTAAAELAHKNRALL